MDTEADPWTARLKRLLEHLENEVDPDVVIMESRSGLHDIAAATVTDVEAQVLLFATDSESNWTDYEILFRHWQHYDLATSIRERLSVVSALTPELETKRYLQRFRERAWDLFRDHLYDEVAASGDADPFSFDLQDEGSATRSVLRPLDPRTFSGRVTVRPGADHRQPGVRSVPGPVRQTGASQHTR